MPEHRRQTITLPYTRCAALRDAACEVDIDIAIDENPLEYEFTVPFQCANCNRALQKSERIRIGVTVAANMDSTDDDDTCQC